MKTYFKYILGASLSAAALVSCDKEENLNPVPETTIPVENSYDTPERIENQMRAVYSGLKGGSFYGGRYVVYGDIRGEDFLNLTTNLVTGSDVWNLNPTNSSTNSVVNLWSQAYFTINQANLLIEGLNQKGTSVVGEAKTKNYLGEAKLIRALSYYSLLQYYARPYADGNGSKPGLPLRLTGVTSHGQSDMARSTVAEVYTQIIKDLDSAEQTLPLTNSSALLNTTRAHRNTAIALKTRVYLSMQKYDKVIEEANKIVPATAPFVAKSGVAHALEADIANVFKPPYTTNESILSMPHKSGADVPGTQNQLGFYFYQQSKVGSAEYSLNPAGIIGDADWKATDKRRGFIYTSSTGAKFMSKYTSPNPYTDYVPVIRWSEVLLNLAEALARTNGLDLRAVALLNAVRERSDATTVLAPATAQQLIDAILKERRIEFLGEGLRNNDLMRLLQTIPAKGAVAAKAPTEQGYIWPISSVELSLNKLMTDN